MLGSAASLLVLRWQPLLMVFPPCFLDFNILGVDFLHHFQLTVDVTAKRLRHRLGHITAAALGDSSLISSTTAPMAVPCFWASRGGWRKGALPRRWLGPLGWLFTWIYNTFTDVLNADGRLPPATHGVEQHIGTNGRPVTAKFQWLDSAKLAAASQFTHQTPGRPTTGVCTSSSSLFRGLRVHQTRSTRAATLALI